jgi:hypothetical protein
MKKLGVLLLLIIVTFAGIFMLSKSHTFQLFGEIVPRVDTDRKGHELGNHSYSHVRMWFKPPSFYAVEFVKTLRSAGYEFVTVDELLKLRVSSRAQSRDPLQHHASRSVGGRSLDFARDDTGRRS